jgi:chromosomal replication initiator protein
MKVRSGKRLSSSSNSLGRFVSLPENHFARRAIRQLAARQIKADTRRRGGPILYLHGPPGTGKSHLVQGLLERVIANSASHVARNVPARDLGRFLGEAPSANNDVVRSFRECDLLIVEDIQHLPIHAADSMANLIDHRNGRQGSLVMTSSLGPAMLPNLPKRLTSRLASGWRAAL